MFTQEQYRAKANEYAALAKSTKLPNEVREFQKLEQSFAMLADNEQWLAHNRDKTLAASDVMPKVPSSGHLCSTTITAPSGHY